VLAADAADLNPISPEAAPGGVDLADNATNSVEQEVATETWVDHALDMLTRGANQQEIVAKLAHDGCPDPEAAYQRALEHQSTESNEFDPEVEDPAAAPEIQQDSEFSMPPQGLTANVGDGLDQYRHTYPEQPEQNQGVQGVEDLKAKLMQAEQEGDTVMAQQLRDQLRTMWQGYTGKVRVANFEGTFRGMDYDEWGRLVVAVDTPHGVQQLNGEIAEPVSDESDEVSEIQQFIDSIPEAKPNDIATVASRIEHLQEARKRIVAALGRADDESLPYLVKMREATAGAIRELTSNAEGIVTASEREYLSSQSGYEVGAVVAANGSVGGFDSPDLDPAIAQMTEESASYNPVKAAREDAAILVAELPDLMVHDAAAIRDLAEASVMERTAAMDPEARKQLVDQFCDAVEAHRARRAAALNAEARAHTASVDTVTPDNDGPAEALFY